MKIRLTKMQMDLLNELLQSHHEFITIHKSELVTAKSLEKRGLIILNSIPFNSGWNNGPIMEYQIKLDSNLPEELNQLRLMHLLRN